MRTLAKVARLLMIDPLSSLLPWVVLALAWSINMVIFGVITHPSAGGHSGGVSSFFIIELIVGVFSATRFLPFGLTLGLSRRAYFGGLATLVLGIAAFSAGVLTALNLLESESGGWGIRLHFFRVHWFLDGPWYRTFLTEFVLVVACSLLGVLVGVTYQKVGLIGVVAAVSGVAVILTIAAVLISWNGSWHGVGHFLTSQTAPSVTGWLAVFAGALGLSGYATMRRVRV